MPAIHAGNYTDDRFTFSRSKGYLPVYVADAVNIFPLFASAPGGITGYGHRLPKKITSPDACQASASASAVIQSSTPVYIQAPPQQAEPVTAPAGLLPGSGQRHFLSDKSCIFLNALFQKCLSERLSFSEGNGMGVRVRPFIPGGMRAFQHCRVYFQSDAVGRAGTEE